MALRPFIVEAWMPEPVPFERTLRSLEGDGYGRTLVWTLVTLLVFAAWGAWLLLARVPLFAASASARLEVQHEAFRVESASAGELRALRVEVGERVEAGEILFEIVAQTERRQLEEERARQRGLREELSDVRAALATRRREIEDRRTATAAELAEEAAVLQSVHAAAELAANDAERAARLYESGLISASEVERLRSVADQRRFQAQAAERAVEKVEAEAAAASSGLATELAQQRREVATLEAQLRVGAEAVARLQDEVNRRTVRSPVAGVVGEMARLQVGAQVDLGEDLATIVPDVAVHAVAFLDPAEAMGRIRPGQLAEIRLQGFPWTEFGSLDGRVTRVASEPRDDRVRVELAVAGTQSLPLRHGLPCRVLVRVDEVTPLSLVLRAVGHRRPVPAAATH